MKLNMTRHEVCNLLLATTSIKFAVVDEINDENTPDERKEFLARTIDKWAALHDKIKMQLDAFDEIHQPTR